MRSFEYFSPKSQSEACVLLAEFGTDAQILAGGTDVMLELRKPTARSPKALVDISRIPGLKGVEESGDSIVIRPLTTHTEILRSDVVATYAPLLRAAVSTIGSPQVRNRGTVGGNIMNAAACADTVPPLIALNAEIKLKSSSGERIMVLMDFFVKPYVTAARRDEILIEIRFPKLPVNARSSFIRLGRRKALSIARLSVAAILQKDESGVVTDARIVPGAAFPKWQRVPEAERLLIGLKPSRELFAEAGRRVSDVMISFTGRRWSTEYKVPVIAALVRRALEACT
jgi:CO/xanthine dehydrogenase FAD-binding subunit